MGIKFNSLLGKIDAQQTVNVDNDGVNFTGEEFTQLYQDTYEAYYEHIRDVDSATVKGILVGATGIGLTWLGVAGWKKFRKHKLKEDKKAKDISKLLEEVDEALDPEVVDKIRNGKVKRLSRKDKDNLANIITEIDENGKIR